MTHEITSYMNADSVLAVVPIGVDQALPATEIWKLYGLWSRAWVRRRLETLAERGRIQRAPPIAKGGFTVQRYYREA